MLRSVWSLRVAVPLVACGCGPMVAPGAGGEASDDTTAASRGGSSAATSTTTTSSTSGSPGDASADSAADAATFTDESSGGSDVDGCLSLEAIPAPSQVWVVYEENGVGPYQGVAADSDDGAVSVGEFVGAQAYDGRGNPTWTQPIRPELEEFKSVSIHASGQVFLGASTPGHAALLKLTGGGDELWTIEAWQQQRNGVHLFARLRATADGGVLAAGGDPVDTNLRISRFDADANGVWERNSAQPFLQEDGIGFDVSPTGTIYTAAAFGPGIDATSVWIAAWDLDGNPLWEREVLPEFEPTGELSRIAVLALAVSEGQIVIGGSQLEYGWIAAFSELDGADEWSHLVDPVADSAQVRAAVALPSGDVVVAGQLSFDVWLRRLSPDGSVVWEIVRDGFDSMTDSAEALALGPDGSIFVGGGATCPRPADNDYFGAPRPFVARLQP